MPDQFVYPIGMMLLGTAALAVPCYLAKQSQIICYIVVGGFIQIFGYQDKMQLSTSTASALFDLGILLVLFCVLLVAALFGESLL